MSATAPCPTLPASLLLATDLSARCDRALERAAQLAAEWQAELLAFHALDDAALPDQVLQRMASPQPPADPLAQAQQWAQQQLQRDLAGLPIRSRMQVAPAGDAAVQIAQAAQQGGAGLIVTGMARSETLGRFLLGSTVERLARHLPQPLLVVRSRVHHPYQQVVVACDFSAASRHALQCAAALLPGRNLVLYHAHAPALAELAHGNASTGAAVALAPAQPPAQASTQPSALPPMLQQACRHFLAGCSLPASTQVQWVIGHEPLETGLTRHVRQHATDLVVLGAPARSSLLHTLLGSSVERLLNWLPCDTLIVPKPAHD